MGEKGSDRVMEKVTWMVIGENRDIGKVDTRPIRGV